MNIAWTGGHRAFAFEMIVKTDKSVIATDRDFRAHLILRWNDAALDGLFRP